MKQSLAPRHLQLRELLLHRWKADGVQIGDRIESQNEIAKICDFSLITIVKTLKDLEADGIIRRQVGKGSFLVRTPWTEAHHRIGMFYNRDVVGGGIFNNDFYTRLVVGLEKAVVSDGHEFIMGSFTNAKMPMVVWETLDVVLLTSITGETNLDFLETAATQIGVVDQTLVHPRVHCYRLGYEDAFADMFRHHAGSGLRILYLDSEITSSEQSRRRDALGRTMQTSGGDTDLEVLKVNQETASPDIAQLLAAADVFRPDIVMGYMHASWQAPLAEQLPNGVRIYPYGLDTVAPGFVVSTDDWMQAILPRVYGNLTDRRTPGAVHEFPVRFES